MIRESGARLVPHDAKPRYPATISDGRVKDQRRPSFDPFELTPVEKAVYYSGDWLAAHPVKSKRLRPEVSDAEVAAARSGYEALEGVA